MITRGSFVRSYHPTVPDHLMYEGVVTLGPDGRGFAVIACEVDGLPVWRLVHWDSLRENVETRCAPLCGADRAAGVPVDWWMHEALCPAREGRKPENVETPT